MLVLFLVLAIVVFVFSSSASGFVDGEKLFSRSVCDKPIEYRVGSIDKRFNLRGDQVVDFLDQAASIWEMPSARDLFSYSETATLTVNFTFDRKQSLHNEIVDLEKQLDEGKGNLEERRGQYQKQVLEFNSRVEQLNSEIAAWNQQGGAPREEFEKLIARQNDLRQNAQKLEALARELNLSAFEYNVSVDKLNENISQFNYDLQKKPEEGLYSSEMQTIEIYFVPSNNELVHTLAHELGHAVGLSHVEYDADSIMFPFSSDSLMATPADISELNLVCAEKSLPEAIITNSSTLIREAIAKFSGQPLMDNK